MFPDGKRCFVIAEAGTAHMGRMTRAMELVEAASLAGADAIKFQWFKWPINPNAGGDMFCWLEGDEKRSPRWCVSELTPSQWAQVKEFAEACGLVFLASAFQTSTVKWLVDLGVVATKVASRAAKTFPYDTPGLPRPLIISNGMFRLEAYGALKRGDIGVQCEAKYPSTAAWSSPDFGFSDHSGKPFLGIDAISRGCKLLEVHFAIEVIQAGPDLPACLTVEGLELVCEARDYYANRA